MDANAAGMTEADTDIFLAGYRMGLRDMRERAAMCCEAEADRHRKRDELKWAELKQDAETGAGDCAYAIRSLPIEDTNG